MLPENRIPTHPGTILRDEFLAPLALTQVRLARHLGVPVQRINELINGKRGVTAETAWMLAGAFETTPGFWMNLQATYDLARQRPTRPIAPIGSLDGRDERLADVSTA